MICWELQGFRLSNTKLFNTFETVSRDSDTKEITKAYRKMALKWHPDKFVKPAEKKDAEKVFMRIAAGYEVLKDEESRKDYDYMLDHPEETYGNYYR